MGFLIRHILLVKVVLCDTSDVSVFYFCWGRKASWVQKKALSFVFEKLGSRIPIIPFWNESAKDRKIVHLISVDTFSISVNTLWIFRSEMSSLFACVLVLEKIGAGAESLCSSSVVFLKAQHQKFTEACSAGKKMLLFQLIIKNSSIFIKTIAGERAKKYLHNLKEQNDVSWGNILVWIHSYWKRDRGWLFIDNVFWKYNLFSKENDNNSGRLSTKCKQNK